MGKSFLLIHQQDSFSPWDRALLLRASLQQQLQNIRAAYLSLQCRLIDTARAPKFWPVCVSAWESPFFPSTHFPPHWKCLACRMRVSPCLKPTCWVGGREGGLESGEVPWKRGGTEGKKDTREAEWHVTRTMPTSDNCCFSRALLLSPWCHLNVQPLESGWWQPCLPFLILQNTNRMQSRSILSTIYMRLTGNQRTHIMPCWHHLFFD